MAESVPGPRSSLPFCLTIRYESLIEDFENTMAAACDHVGINLSDEILSFFDHASVHRNTAYFTGLEKMHNKSIGKWKKNMFNHL